MQANCRPPTGQMVAAMSLPEATVAGMRGMLPGQCVVAIDRSWLQILDGNLWLDNLHVSIVPRKLVPQITAVVVGGPGAARQGATLFSRGINMFMTRMTFQSSHRVSSRTLEVRNEYPPGADSFLSHLASHLNSILVQGVIRNGLSAFISYTQ